jgi:hypothetical protein
MPSPHAVDRLKPLLVFHLPRLQPRLSPDAQVKNVKSYPSKDDRPLMVRLWSRRPCQPCSCEKHLQKAPLLLADYT